jgi:hypothetical protein
MLKLVKNLAVTLLNATLLLIVAGLFLVWKITGTAEMVAQNFAVNLSIVAPLSASLQSATDELAGLRRDLAILAAAPAATRTAGLQRLQDRVAAMDSRLSATQQSIANLVDAPELLMDHAIETAFREFTRSVNDIRRNGAAD